jgi:hypothetical protein
VNKNDTNNETILKETIKETLEEANITFDEETYSELIYKMLELLQRKSVEQKCLN